MKLELDINSAQNSSLDTYPNSLNHSETSSDEVKKMLRAGIGLAKDGNRAEARQMLLKVTEVESNNETAWLWLASISEYPEELLVFLQNVLKINPENERALEWAKQTKTLLSKTFVQRGINAARENQKDFARQCFLQGIVHDSENEMAWLWLASTSDVQEEKISHLQKVLQINPNNETALSSLHAVKNQVSQSILRKANSAAISGDRENAKQMLETIMKNTPNLEEAWLLKAYLADEFYEKIECYQKALEINPENEAAQAGLASLQALAVKANKTIQPIPQPVVNEEEPVVEQVEEQVPAVAEFSNEVQEFSNEVKEVPEEFSNEVQEAFSDEFQEEVPAQFEEVFQETEQSSPELVDEAVVEETIQPAEENENQPFYAEQKAFEEFIAEEFKVEPKIHNTFVEETQTESVGFMAQVEQPQMEAEFVPESQVESFVEEQKIQMPEESFVPQVQETATFVQEELLFEESVAEPIHPQVELEIEPADSPTQELDEEFARTADAVFNSFEQSEVESEEVSEVFQEFQSESQVFENPVVEKETASEQFQAAEFQAPAVFESVPTHEAVTETAEPEAEETLSSNYQATHLNNNGFELLPTELFADYQQPTVELSYSNLNISTSVFEELNESSESIPEETVVQEFVPAETQQPEPVQHFEQQTELAANDYIADVPVQSEFGEEPTEEIQSPFQGIQPQYQGFQPQYHEVQPEVQPQVQQFQPELQPQIQESVETKVQPQLAQCPFCNFENEAQTVVCHSCQSMLSLSDLEMLLAHQGANQDLLLFAIEKMEVERTVRDFSAEELMLLGVAHLNAKNLRRGFAYLQNASDLNPNDVVLASKVNFLAIRLNEIEEHDHKAQENPVQSRTIMVVDDSPTVRKLISGKLEKCGHSVISAVDGMDALAKINEVIPDLILLDITMPRLDGYQVCKLIRNNEITKEIPIVMISGKDGFFDKVRGRMAGSSGYITKPFGPDTLMKTIESYLN